MIYAADPDEISFPEQPELALWAAVFSQGARDYAISCMLRQPPYDEPQEWFWSDEDHIGSFVWLCDVFNLQPHHARSQILLRLRQLAGRVYMPDADLPGEE